MCPFLDLGFVKIPMYGLCIVVGGFIGCGLVYFVCKKLKRNYLDFIIIAAISIGFSILFAKLLFLFVSYPITQIPKLLVQMFTDPKNSPVSSGGFVFYGGIIGGAIGYFIGVKNASLRISMKHSLL